MDAQQVRIINEIGFMQLLGEVLPSKSEAP